MLYFLLVAVVVYTSRRLIDNLDLEIPFEPVIIMSTALAIFLGFKNNEAYARWWEARIILGLAVNYSRAWSRQVLTLIQAPPGEEDDVQRLQHRMIYRHIAFIHALRVFLRTNKSYAREDTTDEPGDESSTYYSCRPFLGHEEFDKLLAADNPPESLVQAQGRD